MSGGGARPTDPPGDRPRPAAEDPRLAGAYLRFGKRLLDLALAIPLVTLMLLPALTVAILVRLVDGPGVLFSQLRVGRRGRLFRLVKFRTMVHRRQDADTVTVARDPRVTPLGALLRRFKMDELPQLVNVLRGDMSFVGPRPDVSGYMDALEGDAAALRELRPGITGPATLVFRDEEGLLAAVDEPSEFNDLVLFPTKVRLNLRYLGEMSLAGDLKWMILTVAPRRRLHAYLRAAGWMDMAGPTRPEDETAADRRRTGPVCDG